MTVRRGSPLLAVVALLGSAAAAVGDELPAALEFERLNRAYSDFAPELASWSDGAVGVRLQSPKQSLVLRGHRIRLTPLPGGLFAGALELDLLGKARMIADLELGPLAERFDEEVVVPPQTVVVAGKVRMRRIEGGYRIDAIELPPAVEISIQSATLNAVLALCDQASILSLGSLDCGGLGPALTRPRLPIPAGQSFELADDDLTADDRRELDALLGVAAQ